MGRLWQSISSRARLLSHFTRSRRGQLAETLEARYGIDPVLAPLVQDLIAADDNALASAAMASLTAQARFAQTQRRMELPLSELLGDLLHDLLLAWREYSDNALDAMIRAEAKLRNNFDESPALSLMARVVAGMGQGGPRADIDRAGAALFLSALAARSGQRIATALSTHPRQTVRLALAARSGLDSADVEADSPDQSASRSADRNIRTGSGRGAASAGRSTPAGEQPTGFGWNPLSCPCAPMLMACSSRPMTSSPGCSVLRRGDRYPNRDPRTAGAGRQIAAPAAACPPVRGGRRREPDHRLVEIAPLTDADGKTEGCTIDVVSWQTEELPPENDIDPARRRVEINRHLADCSARLDPNQRLLSLETEAPDLAEFPNARWPMSRPTDFVNLPGMRTSSRCIGACSMVHLRDRRIEPALDSASRTVGATAAR